MGAIIGFALDTVATKLVDRLRRQANMTADGDTAFHQIADGVCNQDATFHLDHMGARLDQLDCIHVGGFLIWIGAERHIGHNQCRLVATCHAGGMVSTVIDGNRQGGIMSLADHAQRITDQQCLDTALVQQ